MEAGFSKSSLINIIDNPADKEIVRELCLAALAQGKKAHSRSDDTICTQFQKTKFTEFYKVGCFFKTLYFLVIA